MSHPHPHPLPRLTRGRAARLFADESGAATAEYAIATMAAVAFAGLLVVIIRTLRMTRGETSRSRGRELVFPIK